MLPPLEFLTIFINTKVLIKLKNGDILSGVLEGVDNHINMMLSDYNTYKKDNLLFIRGENVSFIGQNE